MSDQVMHALEGAYDVHIHAKPCIQARRRTMLEAAGDYAALGMKGFVVKDHDFPTAQIASVVNEAQSKVTVLGGVTVSRSIGGVNPTAVETCFKLGGRVFWMSALESAWMFERIQQPSFKSAANYKNLGVELSFTGLRLTQGKDSDELLPETREIIGMCKKYGAVFETGHCSQREALASLKECNAQDHKKFVITHANADITPYTVAEQKEFVEQGAVVMYSMASYLGKPGEAGEDITALGGMIREIGPKNILLTTDFGVSIWPPASEGMRMMVAALLQMGIPAEDIRVMIKENPERLYFDQ